MSALYPGAGAATGAPENFLRGPSLRIWLAAERVAVAVLLDLNGDAFRELAVLDPIAAELAQVDIAVVVDVVGASHALLALRVEERLAYRVPVVAVLAGALHR